MKTLRKGGFTLIEVMVALAILGLGLASLFTSQVGAIKVAQRARSTTVATLLARCKMGEIEERILDEGIPYSDVDESDECCEGMEHEGFECDWSIERIVLPEPSLEDGTESLTNALTGGGSDDDEEGAELPDPNDIGQDDVSSMLGGTSDMGGMLESITSMALPALKPIIEEQIRRANVTVKWKEGDKEMSFDVVQFLVSEVGAPVPNPADEEETSTTGTATQQGTQTAGSGSNGEEN